MEPMRTEVVDVTPAMAQEWLEGNTLNRPMKPLLLTDITNAMLNGKFPLIHQSVALTADGRVLDGQHRLTGVVQSGKTVPMNVTFNADPATFDVIDAGAKRSVADAVNIRFNNPFSKANVGACRVIALYDRIDPASTVPWNQRTYANAKLDRATLAGIAFDLNEDMNRLIADVKDYSRSWRLNANSLAAMFVIRRDTRQDKALVEQFLSGVVSGANLPHGDVRLKLREALANNPAFRRNDARLGFGATVKGWNLYVQGDSPQYLRFTRETPGAPPL